MRCKRDYGRTSLLRRSNRFAGMAAIAVAICCLTNDGEPRAAEALLEDPFPIRRVLLPADQLAAEIEKVDQGILVRMSRAEFEGLVRKAALAVKAIAPAPRLVEARYRARLQDGPDEPALIGTAEWKIAHAGKAAALLGLEPVQIALRQARWTDGRAAAIGLIDLRNPAAMSLLVDEPGEQSLAIEWSARGLRGPGEISFTLQLPPAAAASLELELPAAIIPTPAEAEAILTGPFPIDDKRQSWRIACGGLTRVELSLRNRADASRPTPLQRTRLTARQELGAGLARCRYDFDLEVLRAPLTELLLDHDAELTIADVSVNNLEGWKVEASPLPGKRRLTIRFREPTSGGRVEIAATAPVPTNEPRSWSSPGMAVAGGVSRGESLELRLAPELQLSDWRSGSFQLLRADAATDGGRTFVLQATLGGDSGANIRPQALVRAPSSEFTVRQQLEWLVEPQRASLVSTLQIEVQRGSLNQLALRMPESGWTLESAEAAPRELTPQTGPLAGKFGGLLLEFPRPILPGTACTVTVRFHRPGPRLDANARQVLPLPELTPVGARRRDGTLVIRVGRAFQASAPTAADDPNFVGPPLPPPDGPGSAWIYPFHGHPPVGSLQIRARLPRLSAHTEADVSVVDGQPRVRLRLRLSPEGGVLPAVVLWFAQPAAEPLEWRTVEGGNPVTDVAPLEIGAAAKWLSTIAARHPLEATLSCAFPESGARWYRITFARPLEAPVTLETAYSTNAVNLSGASTSIPLPLVVDAERSGGFVTLAHPGRARRWQTGGLVAESSSSVLPGRQRFRFGDSPVSLHLVLGEADGAARAPQTDAALLTAAIDRSGPVRCLFQFRIRDWTAGMLPIRLPAGAEVLAAAVERRAVELRVTPESDAVNCTLPVPLGPGWQDVELLYDLPASSFRFTARFDIPTPKLSVALGSVERVWRLAATVLPVNDANVRRLPGAELTDRLIAAPGWMVRPLASALYSADGADRDSDARAIARPSFARPPQAATFGQALLTFRPGTERLVLDCEALDEARVDADTALSGSPANPFWEGLGLIALPVPEGLLLTTPRQASVWRAEAYEDDRHIPFAIREAARSALRVGRDGSGRFYLAPEWLKSARDHRPSLRLAGADGPGWTAWAAASGESQLRVVNVNAVGLGGALLGIGLLIAAIWSSGRAPRRDWVLLTAWLLAASAAVVWLPASLRDLGRGPLLAGILAGFFLACRRVPRYDKDATAVTRPSPRRPAGSSTGQLASATLLIAVLAARGADPEPAVVFLLPNDFVLAAVELRDRLVELADLRPPLPDAAVLRARFEGRVRDDSAEFEAQFDIHCFVDRPTEVTIPLGGIRLREAMLDGAAAFPKAAGPDRYRIDVNGKGAHKLSIKFAAAVAGSGTEREARLAIPELVQTQLKFTAPPGSEVANAVNWRGAQHSATSGGSSIVEADLGRSRVVHVRWRQSGTPAAPQVLVQEAALWDINGPSATLLAAFDFRIAQGSLNQLRVAIPSGLEVGRVDVRPEPAPANAPPIWVRDWRLSGDPAGTRALTVELQAPLAGRVRLYLELLPARALTSRPVLLFPAALDVTEAESYAALRIQNLTVPVEMDRQGVTEYSADSFLRDVWRPVGAMGGGLPTRAFRRIRGGTAVLRPTLMPTGSGIGGWQELIWRVGPSRLEVRGKARWTSVGGSLMIVEWEVPPGVVVTDVSGAGLQSWSRSPGRVQAWLQKPAAEVALDWTGLVNRPAAASDPAGIDLPLVRLAGVAAQTTLLRLRPTEGWSLTASGAEGFAPIAALVDRETAFQTETAGAPLRVALLGPQANASFRAIAFAEVRQRELHVAAHIEGSVQRDRPHSLTIRARDTAEFEARIDAPGCTVGVQPAPNGSRAWSIEVPPRGNGAVSITVQLARPLTSVADVNLPAIEVLQGELPPAQLEQLFAIAGPEILARDWSGLRRVPESAEQAALRAWPREADRLRRAGGGLWRATDADWHIRVTAAPVRLASTAPVLAVLADYEAAPAGSKWAFRATYTLAHEAGTTVLVQPPADAVWVGAALDGKLLAIADRAKSIPVALQQQGGARMLQVIWERSDPVWAAPRLACGDADAPIDTALWTAYLPPDWRIEGAATIDVADTHLRRAGALLRAARQQTERESDGKLGPSTRLASEAASWLAIAGVELDGRALVDSHIELVRQLEAFRLEKAAPVTASLASSLPYSATFERGAPVRWSASDEPAAQMSLVRADAPWARALGITGFLALVIAALAVLSLLPARFFRPERAALVGLTGAIAFGWPDGVMFLLAALIAMGVRLVAMGRRVLRGMLG